MKHAIASCGLALLCASCLTSESTPEGDGVPPGPSFADTATIQEMLVGRTTIGTRYAGGEAGNPVCDYYAPDGQLVSVDLVDGVPQQSTRVYAIDDDELCISGQQGQAETCYSVVAKRSTSNPSVWGGDFHDAAGALASRVVTADGNQVARCH